MAISITPWASLLLKIHLHSSLIDLSLEYFVWRSDLLSVYLLFHPYFLGLYLLGHVLMGLVVEMNFLTFFLSQLLLLFIGLAQLPGDESGVKILPTGFFLFL